MPRRSVTPGRNPSMRASAVSTSASTTSTPSGDLRSTPMDRRPRASRSPGGRSGSPPDTFCARSMRMTSAPMSARSIPQYGAGPSPASSTTVMPASGPAMCVPPVVPTLAAPAAQPGWSVRCVVTASTMRGQSCGGRSWPIPSTMSILASGTTSAVRSPPDGWISVSSVPWITSVGTSRRRSPSDRLPEAKIAASWRVVAAGSCARSHSRAATVRSRSSSMNAGLPQVWAWWTLWSPASSRSRAGGASSAVIASGVGWPTSGSPVIDMIDTRARTRSRWFRATVWAIIPPIETPTMCARSTPRWSSRPTASSAMSATRTSRWVDSPASRLSKRTTRKPRSAIIRQNSGSHSIICMPRPANSRTVGSAGSPTVSCSISTPLTRAIGMTASSVRLDLRVKRHRQVRCSPRVNAVAAVRGETADTAADPVVEAMGNDLRFDELNGAPVLVSPGRQRRPDRPADDCPFCVGGLEAPEPYTAKAFPNRWPSFPDGRSEIVLYTPVHDRAFWQLGPAGVARVVDLWADRTAALGARDDVAYVLVFENRGTEVGATIDHPHGQLYALDRIADAALTELRRSARDGCPLCRRPPAELVVAEAGGWAARGPPARAHPYGPLLAPDAHRPDLPALDRDLRDRLATLLADVLARFDRLFDRPLPYMLWIQ